MKHKKILFNIKFPFNRWVAISQSSSPLLCFDSFFFWCFTFKGDAHFSFTQLSSNTHLKLSPPLYCPFSKSFHLSQQTVYKVAEKTSLRFRINTIPVWHTGILKIAVYRHYTFFFLSHARIHATGFLVQTIWNFLLTSPGEGFCKYLVTEIDT